MSMGIRLTAEQISALKSKAITETNREIYSITFDEQEITINDSWSIQRDNTPINENIITAIEKYCTRDNIEWEYASTYSAWCD
jgi:hypothetical protein